MTTRAGTEPCFAFHYQYDGPNRSHDTSPFTIHCTLEKGAEVYYSGVRVVVIAKKTGYDDEFEKAEIQARRPDVELAFVTGTLVNIGPLEDKEEVIDDHALSKDGLPLYTLVFELVDLSDATWSSAGIRFQPAAEISTTGHVQIPETHRVLYECAKSTTVHSRSCVLLLATRFAELRPRPKRNNPRGIACGIARGYPAQMGPLTHGVRILPPSEKRLLFIQPPPEILRNIFSLVHDGGYYENWRKGLVSMSLVCRAWWKTTLCIVYEDFDSQTQTKLDIRRLATTLEGSPMWGCYIKRFSPYCFTNGRPDARLCDNTLTILKTALNMRTLSVGDVSSALVGEFVEVFCKMTELRIFAQLSMNTLGQGNDNSARTYLNETQLARYFAQGNDNSARTYLNGTQLARCFAHWPKLRQAIVCIVGQPFAEEDGYEFAPAQCALDRIGFECGFISMAQLRAITASSQDTLHTVALKSIRGISNKELTSWLLDFGPNLKNLTLDSNVFTRSEAEELAIDETIHQMPNLINLEIDGPVATVLTLLRFEPTIHDHGIGQRHIRIIDPMLIDPHAFVVALRTTKWKTVNVMGLRMSENSELAEEAKEVARERGIFLWMQQTILR